jgi:hypothetical protein
MYGINNLIIKLMNQQITKGMEQCQFSSLVTITIMMFDFENVKVVIKEIEYFASVGGESPGSEEKNYTY